MQHFDNRGDGGRGRGRAGRGRGRGGETAGPAGGAGRGGVEAADRGGAGRGAAEAAGRGGAAVRAAEGWRGRGAAVRAAEGWRGQGAQRGAEGWRDQGVQRGAEGWRGQGVQRGAEGWRGQGVQRGVEGWRGRGVQRGVEAARGQGAGNWRGMPLFKTRPVVTPSRLHSKDVTTGYLTQLFHLGEQAPLPETSPAAAVPIDQLTIDNDETSREQFTTEQSTSWQPVDDDDGWGDGLGAAAEKPVIKPLPSRLEDAVFVCLDFEEFERNHSMMTEIGVAILDTKGLQDIEDVDASKVLNDRMQFAHFRVQEYRNKVNKRYVQGCPENFVFGTSNFISIDDAGLVMDRIFMDPTKLDVASDFREEIVDQKRNIVLVGHALKGDIKTAESLPFVFFNIKGMIDTQTLPGVVRGVVPKLELLLSILKIEPQFLHNAGNDAAFTLKAMVETAIADHATPFSTLNAILVAKDRRPMTTY